MLKNYLKIALRNLWKNKTYSIANILGLSVGLASCFVILLYSVHELSYDNYNEKLDRVCLVTMDFGLHSLSWTQPLVPFPTGPTLKDEYPEVKDFARCSSRLCSIKSNGMTYDLAKCVSADSGIFNILTLSIISGSLKNVFSGANYAVISYSTAERIFGNSEAVGKQINVSWSGKEYYFTIGAVMADVPSTSTFQADCILPIFPAEESIKQFNCRNPNILQEWMPGEIDTYILLHDKNSAEQLSKKLVAFSKAHSTIETWPLVLHLLPLRDLYFSPSTMVNDSFPRGNLSDIKIYSAIALLTLLIACVNFVTLNIGLASARTKEVGVRKVVGASRFDIAKQAMIESLMVSFFSFPIALLLVELFMPSVTMLLGKRLPADYNRSFESMVLFVGVTLVAGILSGSYASFYLSGFHPAEILRNKFNLGRDRVNLRRILVGVQMIIFIGLILASVTMYRQMHYLHAKDMGFDDKNLVILTNRITGDVDTTLGNRFGALESDLRMIPNVNSVAGALTLPGTLGATMEEAPNLSDPQRPIMFEVYRVSIDFFETMGMKMVYGETFAQATPEGSKDALIMNQEAAKEFGITDPSQQLFEGHRIIGVVRDFNFHSLRQKIAPTVFYEGSPYISEIAVKLKHLKDAQSTIGSIEKRIEKFDGGRKPSYQFFDDRLNAMYVNDYKFAYMIAYFTGLSIFVACLGLFAMALFVIQHRVKEIGVRKVLGASVASIILSSTREFVILLFISATLSIPVSIYFTNKWLRDYAYHVDINLVSILFTCLAGLLIVLLTICYQALRAATANPVESLRYE